MSKARILVVDDEPDIVRSVCMRLTAAGYETLSAMDSLQATNLAIKERPDLVILDIGMPAGGGHVVVERLRENANTFATPVIYLTARTTAADYQKAREGGVEKYLTKPFDSGELLAAVEEVLSRVNSG